MTDDEPTRERTDRDDGGAPTEGGDGGLTTVSSDAVREPSGSRRRSSLSRRAVLSGIASAGLVGALVGAGTRASFSDAETFGDPPNLVTGGDGNLQVGWVTDDGSSTSGDPCSEFSDTTDPVIEIGDLDAGDEGTLAVCLDWTGGSAALWGRLQLVADEENGLTGAEAAAGDNTPDSGELASALEATAYEDPECTGDRNVIASGSLAGVAEELRTGVRIGSETTRACFGLHWRLPRDVDATVRTDRVAFTVEFAAEQARHNDGTTSPWSDS